MASRRKNAVLGFITDIGGNVLLTIIGLIAAPIILRLTSKSLYGFWVTTLSILGFLVLADMGIGMSLTRLVAGLTAEKDRPALGRLVSSALFLFCSAGVIFLAIGLGISPFIPGWFMIPAYEASSVVPAYYVAVFAGAVALPLSVFNAIVVGFQRMAVTNTVKNLIGAVAVGVSLALLSMGWGVMALALSSLFTVIATSLANYFYARRICPRLEVSFTSVNSDDLKRLISFGGYFQLVCIANTVAVNADTIVISAARGAAMVTPYVFTSKLATIFSITLASKLPVAVFPALSQMVAMREIVQLQRVFIILTRYSVRLASVGAVFFVIVNEKFISMWVGPQNYGGTFLSAVFVYWILQDTIYRGTASLIYALGDMRKWVVATLAEAGINLGLSVLLVGPLGLAGVALGTSIGKTLTTAWYGPYFTCKKLALPIKRFITEGLFYAALRSLPGVGLTLWAGHILPTDLGWVWIILIGVFSVVTNVIFFEGLELLKPSDLPLLARIQRLLTVG